MATVTATLVFAQGPDLLASFRNITDGLEIDFIRFASEIEA
jgi:hypothetical protein